MSARELDAAGIADPDLRGSYAACRALNAKHGKTYYLATLLLPAWKRPYVHALYGFARYADEIVDELDSPLAPTERAEKLCTWSEGVLADLRLGRASTTDDPVRAAIVDTVQRWEIPHAYVEAFLDSMRMDLTVTRYATFADLNAYMYGSAAVIGRQMLPVLEHPGSTRSTLEPYASDLGVAFQLANIIRDVGEDLRRGRVYLPEEDLAAFGVTRERLMRGRLDEPIRNLLAFQIARCRTILQTAEPGIALLHPASRDCMRTAFELYGGILDAVEAIDFQVFNTRAKVSRARRAAVVVPALARAYRARYRG